MRISGFQKFSLIDYPGKITAIVFTQGCNFNCSYCHNSELIPLESASKLYLPEEAILAFLEKRKGKLEAVTITGGEPLLQADLVEFIRKVKKLGFLVKLDTNGSLPEKLRDILALKLIDYVAMDVKAPLAKYGRITRRKVNLQNLKKSIRLIIKSGKDYEFRTTYPEKLTNKTDLLEILKLIKGAKRYFLQKKNPPDSPNSQPMLQELKQKLEQEILKYVKECRVR